MRFLIDEMFPAEAARHLREISHHEAYHVREVGLAGATDDDVAALARADGYVLVTENVADFASIEDVAVVFALKRHLPAGGGQAAALALLLRDWAGEHPRPYLGPHWPT